MKERLFIVNNIQRINPELAVEIGLNESIVFSQIKHLINTSTDTKKIDGEKWICISFSNLQKNYFPYWSMEIMKNTIKNLERMGLIKIKNFNQRSGDRANWYAIDYDEAKKLRSIDVMEE